MQYNFLDLSGQRFGRWVVIERDTSLPRTMWICVCDCGNTKSVESNSLKLGTSISCGCYRKELNRIRGYKDLHKIQFGKLIAQKFIRRWGQPCWICLCNCGKSRVVVQSHLLNGKVIDCGKGICSKKFVDLTGQKFGKLLVMEFNSITKTNQVKWKCLCDCGNVITPSTAQLKSGGIYSCGYCNKESLIASQVKKYFVENYQGIPEYKIVKNPETGMWLRYDIYIPDNIFVELNGDQHYRFTKLFHRDFQDYEHDKYLYNIKKKFAKKNGKFIEINLKKIKSTENAITYIEKQI